LARRQHGGTQQLSGSQITAGAMFERHLWKTYPTLGLTAAELFEITQRGASLPDRWSATDQCTHDGRCYAGLIDSDGDGQVAVIIARDSDGLYVARASGEVVARSCASVTEALAAVRVFLRQR
jgi:hypothetical protein